MGDLGRRVDGFFGFRYKSFGKRKTPYRRIFFCWWYPLWCGTLSALLFYLHLAHVFLCIGPQLSLPHSVFLGLLVLLVGFLFVQRAFMCMRCVNVARAAASLGPQPPAHCTLTYINYTREYCSPERRAVATKLQPKPNRKRPLQCSFLRLGHRRVRAFGALAAATFRLPRPFRVVVDVSRDVDLS